MEAVTLLTAVVAGILVLCLRPVSGLIVFITTLIWYPYYLTVKIGTVNLSAARILILVTFIKIFLNPDILNKFKFALIDKFVVAFAVLSLVAGLTTTESSAIIQYWSGSVFDMVLPYFAVRIVLKGRDDYLKLLKWVMIVSIPLSITAIYQSVTGNNPFGFLEHYHAFHQNYSYVPELRTGFYRADVTFGDFIMFGMYFAIAFGLCAGLPGFLKQDRRNLFYIGIGILGLGVVSSMSSGPISAGLVLVPVLVLFKYRQYSKIFVAMVISGVVLIEIASNTSWYEALSRLTFSEETAYYRIMLIRKAFGGGMTGHWLTGYGLVDPGWGPSLDGRAHTDLVNHYLMVLSLYGLVGLAPFLGILVCAFARLRESFTQAKTEAERWMVWTPMSTLVALIVTFMSVSLFAQTQTVFFIMLGFCANMPILIGSTASFHTAFNTPMRLSVNYEPSL